MRLASLFVFSLLLYSCAQPIPDVWVCSELDKDSGYCTKTISEEEGTIEGANWHNVKKTALVMPYESWKQIKTYILQQCEKHKDCKRPKAVERALNIQEKLYE